MGTLGNYQFGCLGPEQRLAVALCDPKLAREKQAHSLVLTWMNGAFSAPVSVAWDACALLAPRWHGLDYLLVGVGGELLEIRADGSTRQSMLTPGVGGARRRLRGACLRGDKVWLAGTGFTVLEVDERLAVQNRSPAKADLTNLDAVGFEAVCAAEDGTVYCAGWDGELWSLGTRGWHRESIPTNLILTALSASPSNEIYAVGQAGIVIRGQIGKWEVLPQAIRENLWRCVWFEDTLYATSSQQLFMMENEELCSVELPGNPRSFFDLSARGTALLSTGADELLLLLPDRMLKLA